MNPLEEAVVKKTELALHTVGKLQDSGWASVDIESGCFEGKYLVPPSDIERLFDGFSSGRTPTNFTCYKETGKEYPHEPFHSLDEVTIYQRMTSPQRLQKVAETARDQLFDPDQYEREVI